MIVTDQINDQRGAQFISDALILKKLLYIKQIPRMLAIKRGNNLPGVKIGH